MPNSRFASRVVITWLASVHTCAGRSTVSTLAQTYRTGSIHTGSRTRAMNQNPTDQTALTSSDPDDDWPDADAFG